MLTSLSTAGWRRGQLRVAPPPGSTPGISAIPAAWAEVDPVLRVRRLGLRLQLDLRDNLQRTLFYTGTYEPDLIRFIRHELRQSDVFVDIGAHIGLHALSAARRLRALGGGRVIAFEPMQDSSAALVQAAHENALDVEVVQFALGSYAGTVELSGVAGYDDFDAGVRSRFGNSDVHWPASMVPFDSWVAEVNLDRLDIVKMDVEGAELDVLEGMHESLIRLRPRRLIVELKDAVLQRAGVDAEAIDRFLDRAGYRRAGLSYHRNEVYSSDLSQSR